MYNHNYYHNYFDIVAPNTKLYCKNSYKIILNIEAMGVQNQEQESGTELKHNMKL